GGSSLGGDRRSANSDQPPSNDRSPKGDMAGFRITVVNPPLAHTSVLTTLLVGRDETENHVPVFTMAPAAWRLDDVARRSPWMPLPQPAGASSKPGTREPWTGTTVLDWFFANPEKGDDRDPRSGEPNSGGAESEDKMPSTPDASPGSQAAPANGRC